MTKLKPAWKMLDKDATDEEIEEVRKTYPYEWTDEDGCRSFSRVEDEQHRFSSYEQEYAHWIPGDAREALQGILILDNGLPADSEDEAFKARLCDLLSGRVESPYMYHVRKAREGKTV